MLCEVRVTKIMSADAKRQLLSAGATTTTVPSEPPVPSVPSVPSRAEPLLDFVIDNKYIINAKLGEGSFGFIYAGIKARRNDGDKKGVGGCCEETRVAIKIEPCGAKHPQLVYEAKLYRTFARRHRMSRGIAKVFWYGTVMGPLPVSSRRGPGDSVGADGAGGAGVGSTEVPVGLNILVMEMLGPSLEAVFQRRGRSFSVADVLQLTDQLLSRLDTFHAAGYVHRDIKPENFLMGAPSTATAAVVHIADFGLAKRVVGSDGGHIKWCDGKSLIGTPRYASIRNHAGEEQSFRDDLESVGYMLVYFLNGGTLPWQGLKAPTRQRRYERIMKMKRSLRDGRRAPHGSAAVPAEFNTLLHYAWNLEYGALPDYDMLRKIFQKLGERHGLHYNATMNDGCGGYVEPCAFITE